jgi:UPF0716 protein FxsA
MRSFLRPFAAWAALYAVVELTAVALLIWAVGLGWALVVLAATFLIGVLLSASQVRGAVTSLKGRSPHAALTDGVLVGIGSFLVFVPGIVSTAAGTLMLAPPTRGAMRPLAQTMLTRGLVGRITLDRRPRRTDYIDGEVIDAEVVGNYPNLPAVR